MVATTDIESLAGMLEKLLPNEIIQYKVRPRQNRARAQLTYFRDYWQHFEVFILGALRTRGQKSSLSHPLVQAHPTSNH